MAVYMKYLYLVEIEFDVTDIYDYVGSELSCYVPIKEYHNRYLRFIDSVRTCIN